MPCRCPRRENPADRTTGDSDALLGPMGRRSGRALPALARGAARCRALVRVPQRAPPGADARERARVAVARRPVGSDRADAVQRTGACRGDRSADRAARPIARSHAVPVLRGFRAAVMGRAVRLGQYARRIPAAVLLSDPAQRAEPAPRLRAGLEPALGARNAARRAGLFLDGVGRADPPGRDRACGPADCGRAPRRHARACRRPVACRDHACAAARRAELFAARDGFDRRRARTRSWCRRAGRSPPRAGRRS